MISERKEKAQLVIINALMLCGKSIESVSVISVSVSV